MTSPLPVRILDDLLLGLNEHRDGTHAVFVFGTACDAGERGDSVVDDDTDLGIGGGVAGEYC